MSGRREYWVALALLVVPAVGLGQWSGSLNLTSDGMSEIAVDPGESFVLTVGLDSNQPVGCVQFRLTVNDGADDHLFEGQFDPIDTFSYGSLFSLAFPPDPNLFAPGDLTSQMAAGPVSLAGLPPELICPIFGEAGSLDMGIFPGSLVSYTVTMPPVAGYYEFSLTDVILTNGGGGSVEPEVSSLIVTPEPASVLLLLAGLPLLRRRRG